MAIIIAKPVPLAYGFFGNSLYHSRSNVSMPTANRTKAGTVIIGFRLGSMTSSGKARADQAIIIYDLADWQFLRVWIKPNRIMISTPKSIRGVIWPLIVVRSGSRYDVNRTLMFSVIDSGKLLSPIISIKKS